MVTNGQGGSRSVPSTWFSILINGNPKGLFSATGGLRQGDPPSPFLFVIVGEAFIQMIVVAERTNLVLGFSPTPMAPMVSHLQFADDTIIFL